MIWNKNLLHQINDVWYHITKLYLVNNEKNYKIKLNHFFLQTAPDMATTQQYVRKLMLIVASKGDQRERKIQAMMAAKEKRSELFACKQEPFPKNLG